jgi:glutamate-ammonia-ligase adenylyltransferase
MSQSGNQKPCLPASNLPAELRSPLVNWTDNLIQQEASFGEQLEALGDDTDTLARLIASSEYASGVIRRDWEWFHGAAINGAFRSPVDTTESARPPIRKLRNRQMVHLLWRSIGGLDSVGDTLQALSALSDVLIKASMEVARNSLDTRFGQPINDAGESIPPVIMAMGKLGGNELNFSSDIDLIFLYTEDGETNGPRTLSAHEYFTKFSQLVVRLLDDVTEDGFAYRVDTRLRPFGESGPPVVSFAALENYLLQHGRSWERYAYVKARVISPDAKQSDIDALMKNVIDPFVYRQYLDYGVFESLREMKALIATEVRKRELQDNIKLGPGGIREIEFIAQSLQLVRGGADHSLRCRELRTALRRLGRSRGLDAPAVTNLLNAYDFLRQLENGIQAIRDQQTHELPSSPDDRARIRLVMGHSSWDELLADLNRHREHVSAQFSEIAFRSDSSPEAPELAGVLAGLWNAQATVEEWTDVLETTGVADASTISASIVDFAGSSLLRQIDSTAARRLTRFIAAFLPLLRNQREPAAVCDRVLAIVSKIARRSAYVALLNENPAALEPTWHY